MKNRFESRRDFLKLSCLAGVGTLATQGISARVGSPKEKPKNLIFLVVDGMGIGTLSLAQAYSRRIEGRTLEWFKLCQEGGYQRSLQDTASANSPVTDSAAAGSSWGCGERVNNGTLNITPNGSKPLPIFRKAKEIGKATGLVSTCRITHATPASFVANIEDRNSENKIAEQYLQHELDVYLGGGLKHFKRSEVNLLPQFQKKGYAIALDQKSLNGYPNKNKMLGLFSSSHLPYAIDRKNKQIHQKIPGLASMFRSALNMLSRNPNGFVLQVEAGRVDHAGHSNDPAAIVHEQLEFDSCIPIARDFLKKHPDTLLVITTDHGTAGCQLNGLEKNYTGTNNGLDHLSKITGSFESLQPYYDETGLFDGTTFSKMTGISVSEEQSNRVVELLPESNDYFNSAVAGVFCNVLLNTTGVGFSSHTHTSEHVELLALGSGKDSFPPFIFNYQVNGIIQELLDL